MKIYEITFEEKFKVSLVKNPALEMTMVKFAEEVETPLYFANEEKREIFSVAMSPDKLIYRNNIQGEPANVFYTAETIEKFQQNYFRTNANSGTNIDHAEFNTEGVFPFESWIVANPSNDKSNELGLVTKKGDLVMGFKVDNNEVWAQCKDGNLNGLSIEGNVLFKEVNQNNNNIIMEIEKTPQGLWDNLKAFFAADPKEEEKKPEDEALATELEVVEPEKIEAEAASENAPNTDDLVKDTEAPEADELQAKYDALLEENAKLKAELINIEAEKVKADEALVTMASQTPASASIPNLPIEVKKSYNEMTNFEKMKFNKENKK
jgi:hypothetical protein